MWNWTQFVASSVVDVEEGAINIMKLWKWKFVSLTKKMKARLEVSSVVLADKYRYNYKLSNQLVKMGHIKCVENVECGIWTQTCLGLGFFQLDSTTIITPVSEIYRDTCKHKKCVSFFDFQFFVHSSCIALYQKQHSESSCISQFWQILKVGTRSHCPWTCLANHMCIGWGFHCTKNDISWLQHSIWKNILFYNHHNIMKGDVIK